MTFMRKFGLIGYPLGHSLSKKYFSEKFLKENISDCSYDIWPIEEITLLPALLRSDISITGLNVTIPYKETVLGYLDTIDHEARAVGAVNVLKIRREGGNIRLSGFNSDIAGIRETLNPFLPLITNAMVLGTGGSSKAVCHALRGFGISFTTVSRRPGAGIITYADIDERLLRKTQLIINTTPLGMVPDIGGRPEIDYSKLNSDHILFDLVYNPDRTAFLKAGEARGCTTINGLKMLYSQAERSWEIWNDDNL